MVHSFTLLRAGHRITDFQWRVLLGGGLRQGAAERRPQTVELLRGRCSEGLQHFTL